MSDKTTQKGESTEKDATMQVVRDAQEVRPGENPPSGDGKPQTNYNDYGYRVSETVPIPSELFYKILGLSTLVEKDNMEIYYENRQTFEETLSNENKPVVFLNQLGMQAKALRYELNQVHISNVDNGIATPVSVLEKEAEQAKKPAVTLEDDQEKPKK